MRVNHNAEKICESLNQYLFNRCCSSWWKSIHTPPFILDFKAVPNVLAADNHSLFSVKSFQKPLDTEWFLVSQVLFPLFQYQYFMPVNPSCFSFTISLNTVISQSSSRAVCMFASWWCIYWKSLCNPQFCHIIVIAYLPLSIETLNNCELALSCV